MEGLLLFIICTLTFYFMYHFYEPKSSKTQQVKMNQTINQDSFSKSHQIKDSYTTLQAVSYAILEAGVSKASLILGIDLTASNEWQGRLTFNRNSLHKIHPIRCDSVYNPYQRVISIIGKTLLPFTEAGKVFAYGFGDVTTQDSSVFNIAGKEGATCRDFKDVLSKYNEMIKDITLSGPTSFAPIIRRGMNHVKESGNKFHILVIIADGQMEDEASTVSAIIEASKLPISIVLVGVGDGPWDMMEEFDDHLPGRRFDNFQFVDFHSVREARNSEAAFALAALMEIPAQYQIMMELGYFSNSRENLEDGDVEFKVSDLKQLT